jgi:hypothetical protein
MILEFARRVVFPPGSNRAGAPAPPLAAFLLDDVPAQVESRGSVDSALLDELRAGGSGASAGRGALVVVGPGGDASADAEADADATLLLVAGVGAFPGGATPWGLAPGDPSDGAGSVPPTQDGTGRHTLSLPAPAPRDSLAGKLRRAARRAGRRLGRGSVGQAADDPTGVPLSPRPSPDSGRTPGDVLVLPAGRDPRRLPAWARELAASSGIALDDVSYAVVPSRGYRSQKILFLTSPAPGHPDGLALKVTQDARFNARLANEHDALVALGHVDFRDDFGGRIVVGETRVAGKPFRAVSDASAACPLAASARGRLLALASATVRSARGSDVADAVRELVDRFRETHRPGADLASRLDQDLARLAAADEVPTVFTHGDPGPWNLLVSAGEASFLDWENAELRGLPLGDVFYFARTYGAFAAERRGVRWTPAVFVEQFLRDGDLSRLLRHDVDAHLRALGIARELVGPLFRLTSAALAAREAWSLEPSKVTRGTAYRCLVAVEEARGASAAWTELTGEA